MRVLAVVTDLFFSTKIDATARAAGAAFESVAPDRARSRVSESSPDLVLVDLHSPGDPIALIRALKEDASTRDRPVCAFYSHVDQALRDAAVAAGADAVWPRSAFVARLPELLRRGLPA